MSDHGLNRVPTGEASVMVPRHILAGGMASAANERPSIRRGTSRGIGVGPDGDEAAAARRIAGRASERASRQAVA